MTSLLSFFTHKFFKILLALYIGVFLLIWLISSPLIKYFITPELTAQQLHLSDNASIRFNPFLMRLTLNDINLVSTKTTPEKSVFTLANMEVQVALWQLAFNKIVLSKLLIEQGSLNISQHNSKLVIAGIEIDNSAEEPQLTAEPVVEKKPTETIEQSSSSFPYQLLLPHFSLSQFTIDIEMDTEQQKHKSHQIKIEQLILSQVSATETQQQAKLALNTLIDNTHLSLTADTKLTLGKGDINSRIALKNYPIEKLASYVKDLTELKGSLSFKSQQTITLAEQSINLTMQNANLTLQDFLAGLEHQQFTLKELEYNFTDLAISIEDSALTHLTGASNIKLIDAVVTDKVSKDNVVAFNQLSVNDIRFILDEAPSIDIANVKLDEFMFSKKAALSAAEAEKNINKINERAEKDGLDIAAQEIVKLPPVVQLKQLMIDELHIHEKSITVNNIIFDTLTGGIIVNEKKAIANLIALTNDADAQMTPEAATPVTKDSPQVVEKAANANDINVSDDNFIFSFKELRFINNNSFSFTDFSVDPIYQRTLFLDTLTVGALSNKVEHKQVKTPFTFAGRSNKYAKINLVGYLQPFAQQPTYHAKGDFKEFSLPALSSYLKASTGVEVKTGQLNTALDLTLTADQLKGNIVVLLEALETGLVDSEEAGSLIDQGALPLNMAIGMLKDREGNVELDVPISGSTSDPKFGFSSIITLITKKAIISATQEYLLTTFVPYANIVSIAITAGEIALKLRFDDVEYKVEQVTPDEYQRAYLKDFIALMKDKEKTRVTLCAISTPEDIGLPAGVAVKNKADIKRLLDLGEQREHAFKDHLVEQGNIESSRILLCKPQIDSSKGAIPRIAISV